jgi:hypothetical protein
MNQDEARSFGIETGETGGHGILAALAAGDDVDDLGKSARIKNPRPGLGQDQDDVVHAGMGLKNFAAPFEKRPAAESRELLGPAEPRSRSGGDDDGRGPRHFPSSL